MSIELHTLRAGQHPQKVRTCLLSPTMCLCPKSSPDHQASAQGKQPGRCDADGAGQARTRSMCIADLALYHSPLGSSGEAGE